MMFARNIVANDRIHHGLSTFKASFDDHIYASNDSSHANERIQQNVCWFNSEIELTTFSTLESLLPLQFQAWEIYFWTINSMCSFLQIICDVGRFGQFIAGVFLCSSCYVFVYIVAFRILNGHRNHGIPELFSSISPFTLIKLNRPPLFFPQP